MVLRRKQANGDDIPLYNDICRFRFAFHYESDCFLCCRRCFGRYALIGCYAKTIIV